MAIAEFSVKFPIIEVIIMATYLLLGWLGKRTIDASKELKTFLVMIKKEHLSNRSKSKFKPLNEKEKDKLKIDTVDKCKEMNNYYSFYSNITSVLPLLGMLGTVLSLFALAGKIGQEELPIDNFFSALSTTILGIVGAIAFKIWDSKISIGVATNNKEIESYLEFDFSGHMQEVKSHETP